jgi:hypothetical protein
MRYSQRDIVEISFQFPDGSFKPHPAIIVSNDELQDKEGFIYLCMISSKPYHPEYCYELDNAMLTVPMMKKSYVKCHILVGNIERDVIRRISRMKQPFFDEMVDKVIQSIL